MIANARVVDSRKDRKYSLIISFWLDTVVEASTWIFAINLGVVFFYPDCV
jgi:hypothetical protein